ncbi:metal ABC transporter solute-binding protein, Zn/Mn family [Chitinasiproducens palmae]|uniref:Zinc/manganese transport system substrate-binding protein n=1 Tax=Chitinasiproducens palmae TaxID=1770053 RepID=A0A1H2PMS7_9BURK|nr:zinc ABC transporter substrate-binding protein [Chitinasiproducens palmae]SDV47863.1 zinc/manganese transport system substrate-binding protein [Chitinasiproducens palmae]
MFCPALRRAPRTLRALSLSIALFGLVIDTAHAARAMPVVAAENFYGDIVQQIGGQNVEVTSILSNPEQDPHAFEASPTVARQLAAAKLVVYNGAGYDAWLEKLLSASRGNQRHVIAAAPLVGKKDGDNPHLWYLPATMPAVAKAVGAYLERQDPAHRTDYAANLSQVLSQLARVEQRVAEMRKRYAGQPVTASEPVFGYMAEALGLQMRNARFQLAVMNETEPSASDIAAFERDLREHRVRVMIYNSQTSDQMTRRLLGIAKQAGVPTVAVTETQPAGKRFDAWMLDTLDALDRALAGAH